MDTARTSNYAAVTAQLGSIQASNSEIPKTVFPLMRLPFEVRILIYRLVVGNRIIHVAEHPKSFKISPYKSGERYSLYHYGCQSLKSETEIYNAGKATTRPDLRPLHPDSRLPHRDCSLMHWAKVSNELPDTCLLAVSPECKLEATKALWSTNTFSFASDSSLRHWLRLMPQNRLAMIHHLRLEMWLHDGVTLGGCTFTWAQAIQRIPGELQNLVSVNVVLYLAEWLTCWRNSQAKYLTNVFKPLNQLRDLRALTVVFNEEDRRLDGFHVAGTWCGQPHCDHSTLQAHNSDWRAQIGTMWAEEIRELVLRK